MTEIEDVLALSPLQEGLYSLAKLTDGGVDLYSMQFVIDITGPVDLALLRRCADALLVRHPNLRASFWDQDLPHPVQIVPTSASVPWTERDCEPGEFDELAAAERARPFDLASGPVLRIVLARFASGRYRLLLTAHHILLDGWAVAVFFQELLATYEAGGSTAALPTPRPYRDYIAWLNAQDGAAALRAWSDYLERLSGPLMVADGAAKVASVVPEKHRSSLDPAATTRLTEWARSRGFTLNTVAQFAWAVVLGGLTDRRDVAFGTTISGRPEGLRGVESMIGLFINTVPALVVLDAAEPIVDQCARLQRESASMRDKGFASLAAIQRAVGQGALFDTLFVFENAPIGAATDAFSTSDGARFLPVTMESLAHYPLTVVNYVADGSLVVIVEAVPDAIPHLVPADIGARLGQVLRALPEANTLADLDLLLPGERAEVVVVDEPEPVAVSIGELFARQVAATPDAVALTTASARFTYAELGAAVDRLAATLAERGVGPESVVALMLPRSVETVVAIVAVLAAGGVYVPVDLNLPESRIESILRQSAPQLRLTLDDVTPALSGAPVDWRRPHVHPEQAAYVIFTSGSTGEPKGVVGTHAALVSYFGDHKRNVYDRVGRPLTIAHAWSFSFDASWQPLIGLLDGHALHLFDSEEMRDAGRLVDGIRAHGVDMIDTSPSMFTQLLACGLGEAQLAVLALGGEAIGPRMWTQLQALPDTLVFNCYGPTETTVEAVVAPVARYPVPTIGTAVDGMSSYVLDSSLRPVPRGVAGELYLSGGQVTRGYLGRAATTADRFVADPFRPGHRMYRTGDLVRALPDGELSFLGRTDTQVKVRGYRIEISEIESAILQLPGVTAAAVIVVRRPSGASLVGFTVGGNALRAQLADRLPAYMVPTRLIALDRLPMNANGKLDGTELSRIATESLAADTASKPETDTERALSDAFAGVLDATPGVDEDFFDLGMDSIVAISLVNKLRAARLTITPRMVLETPTIRDLAAAIDARAAAVDGTDVGYGAVEPLPVVEWLFECGNYRRFTQTALVRVDGDVEPALQKLLDAHDTLRSVLVDGRLVTREPGAVRAADIIVRANDIADITAAARGAFDLIDPAAGSMARAVHFADDGVLLLTVHHLATDAVSWHILLADLAAAAAGEPIAPTVTSYRRWAQLLRERQSSPEVAAQLDYWTRQVAAPDPLIGERAPDPATDTWASLRLTESPTDIATTASLLGKLTKTVGVREILLSALTLTIASWRAEQAAAGTLLALEGHGREDDLLGTDTAHTVGWFTSVYPVRLGAGSAIDVDHAERDPAAAKALLDTVVDELAAIPNAGLDYGLLRYGRRAPELVDAPAPQIEFNYLGRFDLAGIADQPWMPITDPALNGKLPLDPEPDLPLRYALDVAAAIQPTPEGPQLVTTWRWGAGVLTPESADELARLWERAVVALARTL